MTSLPIWAVYGMSLGTPLFTFLGVLLAQFITRKGDRELETRSRREETMRNLRWAAELSAHKDDRIAALGVAELAALLKADLLDESEKVFVEAALDSVYEEPEVQLDELGTEAEAVQYVDDVTRTSDSVYGESSAVASSREPDTGGVDHD